MTLKKTYQIECDACGAQASEQVETWSAALRSAERKGWRKVKGRSEFSPVWDFCPVCFPLNMTWRPKEDLVRGEHE